MEKFIILLTVLLLTACAECKTFKKSDGTYFVAEPYGWANYQSKKIPGVIYEVNPGNIIWSILGIESIIVPAVLTGWEFYEPVKYIENDKEIHSNCLY